MNCQATTEFFSDYFDGGLQPSERRMLEEHLRDCQTCTVEYRHFTRSLQALHETRPMETTNVFMANLRTAATQQIKRRDEYTKTRSESMTVVTPKADSKPVAKAESRTGRAARPPGLPGWVPWTLAATMLFAFAVGFLVAGRGESGREEELLEALAALKSRPAPSAAPVAVDDRKVMETNGLVEVEGQWIPRKWRDDFAQNKICIGGQMVTRDQAAKMLAKEFPVEAPPPPPPTLTPPSPDEILDKAGYTKVNEVAVPKAWVEKWAEGLVQIGVGEWRKLSDFKEELIKEHNLVEVRGKLMTREQAEAIQAEQFVKPPANAVAANDFTKALDGLQIGPPMNFHGVTVYPLLAAAPPAEASYVTVHAALGSGKVEIADTLGLFQVSVRNGLDTDVLFLAGDVLAGGRCARVVSEHMLVGKGATAHVPVLCVEPGTWKSSGDRFAKESGHYIAPPSVRHSLIADQGQGALWSILARKLGGRPGLVELYRKQADAIAETRAYFSALPDRETTAVGLADAERETLDFVEIFPDHALFSASFERLVAGATLDLLEPSPRGPSAFPNTMKGVKQLLESAYLSSYDAREDGFAVRREETLVGRVRLLGGTLQHALLFAGPAPETERKAAYTVPKDKIRKALDEYETGLKTLGPARRLLEIREMGSINAPEVVTYLARHLTETDTAVRRQVIQELAATDDPRATDVLLPLLARSRGDAAQAAEIIRALAKLGDDPAVEPLLRLLDSADVELNRLVVQAFAELLPQVKSREVLERATGRLIALFESSESVSKGDAAIIDPVVKGLRPAEAQTILEATRATLKTLVGLEFSTSGGARKWFNDREARERFLRDRTQK